MRSGHSRFLLASSTDARNLRPVVEGSFVSALAFLLVLIGCGASPRVEPTEPTAEPLQTTAEPPEPICGNGIVEPGELCDFNVRYLRGCPEGWGLCWGCDYGCNRVPYPQRPYSLIGTAGAESSPWCSNVGVQETEQIAYDDRGYRVAETYNGITLSVVRRDEVDPEYEGVQEVYRDGHLVAWHRRDETGVRSLRYEFDASHRLIAFESTRLGMRQRVDYQLDARGRPITFQTSGQPLPERGGEITYDDRGRPVEIRSGIPEEPGSYVANLTFDAQGFVTHMSVAAEAIFGVPRADITTAVRRNADGQVVGTESTADHNGRVLYRQNAICLEDVFQTMPERPFEERTARPPR
ncbi:MAG: hypothetical protein AAGF12_32975 [Myxococcota bacterium]